MPASVKNLKGYSIISIEGIFNASLVYEIRKIAENIKNLRNNSIILDLAKASGLDSSGIGCIMSLKKQCEDLGGKLIITAISERITGLLKSCAIDKVLSIKPTILDAEASISNDIVFEERGFYSIIKIPLEFNLSIVKPLREIINQLINKGYQNFVFDFERCKLITSVGIGLIVNLHKDLSSKGGGIFLLKIQNEVSSIMESTHIFSVIKSYKSLQEIDDALLPKNI